MILTPNYTDVQLREWLKSELAGLVWRTEAMSPAYPQTLDNAISQALWRYSEAIPKFGWEKIPANLTSYSLSHIQGLMGVADCQFIAPYNIFGVTSSYMANLTGVVVPALSGYLTPAGGLPSSEIQMFQEWSKGYQRVTSRTPQWLYKEDEQQIVIHNPVNYEACAFLCLIRDGVSSVKMSHRHLFANLSLAYAKVTLGNNRNKFSGELPGPGGTTLKLNGESLITQGTASIKELEDKLKAIQPRVFISFD